VALDAFQLLAGLAIVRQLAAVEVVSSSAVKVEPVVASSAPSSASSSRRSPSSPWWPSRKSWKAVALRQLGAAQAGLDVEGSWTARA
jgi:hypothetical protein